MTSEKEPTTVSEVLSDGDVQRLQEELRLARKELITEERTDDGMVEKKTIGIGDGRKKRRYRPHHHVLSAIERLNDKGDSDEDEEEANTEINKEEEEPQMEEKISYLPTRRPTATMMEQSRTKVPEEKQLDEHLPQHKEEHDDEESDEVSLRKMIERQRKRLPTYAFKDKIVSTVRNNQVVVIVGETGSGKSTQIPQYIYDEIVKPDAEKDPSRSSLIAITQPRRVGAVSVARRVAEERGVHQIGSEKCEVGYCVRFSDRSGPSTRIRYLTDGCLLRECVATDPDLLRYAAIVLDEAHERSVNTDVLFGLLKGAIRRRPDLRVIVTSATLDVEKFSQFFSNCPTLRIPGTLFPVELIYAPPKSFLPDDLALERGFAGGRNTTTSWKSNSRRKKAGEEEKEKEKERISKKEAEELERQRNVNATPTPGLLIHHPLGKGFTYFEAALEAILRIHLGEGEGDILCFLTGQDEIERACRVLDQRIQELFDEDPEMFNDKPDLVLLPLYAALPPALQVRIFQPSEVGQRKCVIATNIAETSLTVDGVSFVIDPGFTKQKTYNPSTGMETLEVQRISKVSADQRKGRAGRTREGKCYRLYEEEVYSGEGVPLASDSQILQQQQQQQQYFNPTFSAMSSTTPRRKRLDVMELETLPEIKRSNLANTVLALKLIGVNDVLGFDFLDPPDKGSLLDAIKNLYLLDALDDQGKLTDPIGKLMAKFPVEPALARVLIESAKLACGADMAILVAMLSIENLFYRSAGDQSDVDETRLRILQIAIEAYQRHHHLANTNRRAKRRKLEKQETGRTQSGMEFSSDEEELPESVGAQEILWGDHYLMLNLYRAWSQTNCSRELCKDLSLNFNALKEAQQISQQLLDLMQENHLLGSSLDQRQKEQSRDNRDIRNDRESKRNGKSEKEKDDRKETPAPTKIDERRNPGEERERMLKALCAGYFTRTAKLQRLGFLVNNRPLQRVFIHPSSSLFGIEEEARLDWILYHSLVFTSKGFMRNVSPVEFDWLKESYRKMNDFNLDRLIVKSTTVGTSDKSSSSSSSSSSSTGSSLSDSEAAEAKRNTSSSIEDARQRYLARKAAGKK